MSTAATAAKDATALPASADPWKGVAAYLALHEAVDREIVEAKSQVLETDLAWGVEGQELAAKAFDATRMLATMGLRLSGRCELARFDDSRDDQLLRVILAALASYGSATRWRAMLHSPLEEPPYSEIHALYRRAERVGLAYVPGCVVHGGKPWILSAQAHYIRNLLLPLACDESLAPDQLESVDALLWSWVGDYRLSRTVEGGEPRLWVDVHGRTGASIRQCMPLGEDVRQVVLANMDEHLRVLEADAAAGRRSGTCTSVADHMGMLRDWLGNAAPDRQFMRQPREDLPRAEARIGLPEILATADGRRRPANWVRVRDEGEGGAGLLVNRLTWELIRLGDLVELRDAGEALPRVGIVVRKFSTEEARLAIAVEWIACTFRKLILAPAATEEEPDTLPALHVLGDAESAPGDTLILDDRRPLEDARYEIALDDRLCEIRLNRLLRRGRSWVCVGYDVVGARQEELVS